MKKTLNKTSSTETNFKSKNSPQDEPYEITYAKPDEGEFQLKYSKDVKVSAHMARWFMDYQYDQLIWSDGIYEILEIDPLKNNANYFTYLETVHPNDRYIKINAQENLKKTGNPIEINYRLLFANGRIKWINEICNTDFDTEKRPVRSYGTIQDITRFKLSEDDFNTRKERFKSLIESMPFGIAIIQENKFAFVNPAGHKLLSENQQTAITGKNISTILVPAASKNFRKILSNVQTGQIESTFETKLQTLKGTEFDAEVTLIRTMYRGAPAVELVVNDITDRKRAENLLRQKELRLKETIATKDKFLSIIAHDLRSPFNSILGFLDILDNQYDDFDDYERKSYIKLINENATKTLKLLDNLLVWARAQTGKIAFNPVNQKLYPVVKHVSETLGSPLHFKSLQLKIAIPENLEIYADTNMLKTIIRNLLSNAIKYSLQKGIIKISARSSGSYTEIVISDSGIGMAEEIRSKIFRIDEHISIPGTANETGSGLGLILCKDFTERHNGNITVESDSGKGSTFTLQFPSEFANSKMIR